MTQAVSKMLDVYKQKGIDLFKDAFSLVGIAQKYVHRNRKAYFSSFGKEHKHIYKDMRETVHLVVHLLLLLAGMKRGKRRSETVASGVDQ